MRCKADKLNEVFNIFSHPEVFKWHSDDRPGLDYKEDVRYLLQNENIFILMPIPGCAFMFVPSSSIAYQAHTNAIPSVRGKQTLKAAFMALRYMFNETRCLKIWGLTPGCCWPAHALNKKLGFRTEGKLCSSFQKNNKLYDEIIYGLTKRQWLQKK